jgi:hypothetical protein
MKYLHELNLEELKEVYNKNQNLQEEVFDDMVETAAFWCSEYLACWNNRGINYCIGWDRGTYFKCTDREYFIEGLKSVQRMFGFLADEWNEKIKYIEKLLTKLDYLYYNSSAENYDRVEARIDELIKELEMACYKWLMSEYEDCFDNENQLDYFLNFFADERMDDSFYVDDDMELFEHVEYIKSYK